ncbi:MAG: 30S ribosomal protein S21 [Maribacter sp.]|nr:30S ribosomal protein S21 [Maribacter sp.]
MLKIKLEQGESIDRALKRYKRKYRLTKVLDKIKSNQHYEKQSKQRRETLQKAVYRQRYELEKAE